MASFLPAALVSVFEGVLVRGPQQSERGLVGVGKKLALLARMQV
jgi:hypothetical protein